MIFATDLDGTMIFSKRYLKDDTEVLCIEKKNNMGKEEKISYVTKNAKKILNKVSKKINVVPVTTRTIEQYNRINIFDKSNYPKYLITSNGGSIFIDGKSDNLWNNSIREDVANMTFKVCDIKDKFIDFTGEDWLIKYAYADNLFWAFTVDRNQQQNEKFEYFVKWVNENQYYVSSQESKIYVIPKVVSKWRAVLYVQKMLNNQQIISAGNSDLDLEMIENAYIAYVPLHADLQINNNPNIYVSKEVGVKAGEEILKSVYERFC